MQRHVFAQTDALASELVRLTAEVAGDAVTARGIFSVALTGGSAATTLYPVLAQAALPWNKVHVFFGDERCVPPEHADSNYKLAQETFLSRVPVPEANIHRIRGEIAPADAAAEYERVLVDVVGGVLDVVHVGMGPDGHICSLFPGHPLLKEQAKLVASLTDSPKPPPARVTLTMPALQKARGLWFLVAGGNKADAVREALTDPSSTLPVALATRAHRNPTWLLDGAAAAGVK
ncbi:MAG TPA: 6-phosphogluconolactonase [Myxococcota bacterium]